MRGPVWLVPHTPAPGEWLAELRACLPCRQVKSISEEMGIAFLGTGFDPKWRFEDVPRMPKQRCAPLRGAARLLGAAQLCSASWRQAARSGQWCCMRLPHPHVAPRQLGSATALQAAYACSFASATLHSQPAHMLALPACSRPGCSCAARRFSSTHFSHPCLGRGGTASRRLAGPPCSARLSPHSTQPGTQHRTCGH